MITPTSPDHYHDIVRIYNQAIAADAQTADEKPFLCRANCRGSNNTAEIITLSM